MVKKHREYVGGDFDNIGRWQRDYIIDTLGLQTTDSFLDVACGCLRLGTHLIPYLDSDNYYGIDSNQDILDAGISDEISAELLATKSPTLTVNSNFDFGFVDNNVSLAWANSLFSHLTLSDAETCLTNLQAVTDRFVFTYFDTDLLKHTKQNPDQSHARKDFYYSAEQIQVLAEQTGWSYNKLDTQTHPRKQTIIELTK